MWIGSDAKPVDGKYICASAPPTKLLISQLLYINEAMLRSYSSNVAPAASSKTSVPKIVYTNTSFVAVEDAAS